MGMRVEFSRFLCFHANLSHENFVRRVTMWRRLLSLGVGLLAVVLVWSAQVAVAEPAPAKQVTPEIIYFEKDLTITLHLQVGDGGQIYTTSGSAENGDFYAYAKLDLMHCSEYTCSLYLEWEGPKTIFVKLFDRPLPLPMTFKSIEIQAYDAFDKSQFNWEYFSLYPDDRSGHVTVTYAGRDNTRIDIKITWTYWTAIV